MPRLHPPQVSLPSILMLSIFFSMLAPGGSASAQPHASPRSAALVEPAVEGDAEGRTELPSLRLPRFELITGLALMHLSLPVGALVTLAAGPPLFACGLDLFGDDTYDPEQAECEERAARQSDRAARLGLAAGLATGMVGTVLMLDGAIRLKRAKAVRRRALLRPSAFSLEPGVQRAVASAVWTF